MIVTSCLISANGLFSDFGRASCTKGVTAASVKADALRGGGRLVMHCGAADQGFVVLVIR